MEYGTMNYAKSELQKYLKKVTGENAAKIELEDSLPSKHPFDDVIEIDVKEGVGKILGNSPRAVLIGTYRFFYELGCRFLFPGEDGERIVKKSTKELTVKASYAPANRYRGVCSEGAISEEHVIDMVRWLPKVGMNTYFTQFTDGHLFFEKWYKHKESTALAADESYCAAESAKHYENCVRAIKECGLCFHAVGHGWTTSPLGYVTYGDERSTDADIKSEDRELFAMVGGERKFFNQNPSDTHLCYSNPRARDLMTNAVVEYLKKHSEVDALHFWLADNINNHCECEACAKQLPSDWYVTMLNELDEKLTAAKIDTKIVFLIYCDLLFAPKNHTIKNPDRFILMYAPIARSYFEPFYAEKAGEEKVAAKEYVRNKNAYPSTSSEYLDYLKNWKKICKTDGFAFEYHLMTFEYAGEPSFTKVSRVIDDDMKHLKDVGLSGNVSCQLQRVFLPTGLPNYAMSTALFSGEQSFEQTEEEYFKAAFGEQSGQVKSLLHAAENFYLNCVPLDKRPENGKISKEKIQDYKDVLLSAKESLCFESDEPIERTSLDNIKHFIDTELRMAECYFKQTAGEDLKESIEELKKFVDESEEKYHRFEDSLFKKSGIDSLLG